MIRNPKILERTKTALLIIDIQERILGVMQNPKGVVENTVKLIEGMKILNIPVYFTEQYPKGLGATESTIKAALGNSEAIQKMSFSCGGAGELFKDFRRKGIEQIIICGIESHVCVQQTVLDLLANNFQVDVIADAISSRKKVDYNTALFRMQSNGAEVTTTESVLFELLNVCGTDEFKSVSKLVK
ncbi:MAG: hydrolase [Melioribacteraceae bacterium]|nr:hydrolase [Melioribacteraceae bacterium]MCF8264709.1 hydrolase [Melioribacteraceae bacterium]